MFYIEINIWLNRIQPLRTKQQGVCVLDTIKTFLIYFYIKTSKYHVIKVETKKTRKFFKFRISNIQPKPYWALTFHQVFIFCGTWHIHSTKQVLYHLICTALQFSIGNTEVKMVQSHRKFG